MRKVRSILPYFIIKLILISFNVNFVNAVEIDEQKLKFTKLIDINSNLITCVVNNEVLSGGLKLPFDEFKYKFALIISAIIGILFTILISAENIKVRVGAFLFLLAIVIIIFWII